MVCVAVVDEVGDEFLDRVPWRDGAEKKSLPTTISDDVEVGNAVAKRGVVGSEEVPEVILDAMSERIGINHPRVGDSLNESAA